MSNNESENFSETQASNPILTVQTNNLNLFPGFGYSYLENKPAPNTFLSQNNSNYARDCTELIHLLTSNDSSTTSLNNRTGANLKDINRWDIKAKYINSLSELRKFLEFDFVSTLHALKRHFFNASQDSSKPLLNHLQFIDFLPSEMFNDDQTSIYVLVRHKNHQQRLSDRDRRSILASYNDLLNFESSQGESNGLSKKNLNYGDSYVDSLIFGNQLLLRFDIDDKTLIDDTRQQQSIERLLESQLSAIVFNQNSQQRSNTYQSTANALQHRLIEQYPHCKVNLKYQSSDNEQRLGENSDLEETNRQLTHNNAFLSQAVQRPTLLEINLGFYGVKDQNESGLVASEPLKTTSTSFKTARPTIDQLVSTYIDLYQCLSYCEHVMEFPESYPDYDENFLEQIYNARNKAKSSLMLVNDWFDQKLPNESPLKFLSISDRLRLCPRLPKPASLFNIEKVYDEDKDRDGGLSSALYETHIGSLDKELLSAGQHLEKIEQHEYVIHLPDTHKLIEFLFEVLQFFSKYGPRPEDAGSDKPRYVVVASEQKELPSIMDQRKENKRPDWGPGILCFDVPTTLQAVYEMMTQSLDQSKGIKLHLHYFVLEIDDDMWNSDEIVIKDVVSGWCYNDGQYGKRSISRMHWGLDIDQPDYTAQNTEQPSKKPFSMYIFHPSIMAYDSEACLQILEQESNEIDKEIRPRYELLVKTFGERHESLQQIQELVAQVEKFLTPSDTNFPRIPYFYANLQYLSGLRYNKGAGGKQHRIDPSSERGLLLDEIIKILSMQVFDEKIKTLALLDQIGQLQQSVGRCNLVIEQTVKELEPSYEDKMGKEGGVIRNLFDCMRFQKDGIENDVGDVKLGIKHFKALLTLREKAK